MLHRRDIDTSCAPRRAGRLHCGRCWSAEPPAFVCESLA
ncbi:hypothetical protein DB30_00325 [Enhygromyxa salina]|uniref:Uncharacterized protein n=1 Tax=Enhygromyxa salina TaxID=215803 RepID=A0A0C1ZQT5_9BACT|nr:hypothetical protein DB30_00325 [Enhygromyxa salina]